VEAEVETIEELKNALQAKPDWLLLDNMSPDDMREAVRLCRGKTRTEASGGITIERVREVAETGVDAISLGCLTHSAPAVDLSLEMML
jgi:nicotinate-nucleotide pyrophosphorylase (carboxylating)